MHSWRKLIFNYKSVSWVVLAAVVMLSILPAHIHIHHENDASTEQHLSDVMASHSDEHASSIHTISDMTGHNGHEDVASIPVIPDILKKKINFNPIFIAILIGVFLFLSIVILPQKLRLLFGLHFRKFYIRITPPLRAPPLL